MAYVTCSTLNNDIKPNIVINAVSLEERSTLQNVVFNNISKIQVSNEPPLMENVTVKDTDSGIIFVGSGPANEIDVILSNVKVQKVCYSCEQVKFIELFNISVISCKYIFNNKNIQFSYLEHNKLEDSIKNCDFLEYFNIILLI